MIVLVILKNIKTRKALEIIDTIMSFKISLKNKPYEMIANNIKAQTLKNRASSAQKGGGGGLLISIVVGKATKSNEQGGVINGRVIFCQRWSAHLQLITSSRREQHSG